jgi:hypothetical protein
VRNIIGSRIVIHDWIYAEPPKMALSESGKAPMSFAKELSAKDREKRRVGCAFCMQWAVAHGLPVPPLQAEEKEAAREAERLKKEKRAAKGVWL